MHRRAALSLLAAALAVRPAVASAVPYRLDSAASTVSFNYTMNGQRMVGRMPVIGADILLDLDHPSASRVSAVIDAAHADAGPFFATEAMRDASVLATATWPTIRFDSEKVTENRTGARVTGKLTVRDVTRPVALDAVLYRQRGTEAGDRSKLSILLTGRIDRRDYGAGGYPNIVGPEIGLNILTRIDRA